MTTFSKEILSGSTDGRGILVVATGSPGTTIHTGPTNTASIDEIWLYASNPDGSAHNLTVQWGGVTSPDDAIVYTIPPLSGLTLLAPGMLLRGNATPLIIKAFADTASKVAVHGFVNAIA